MTNVEPKPWQKDALRRLKMATLRPPEVKEGRNHNIGAICHLLLKVYGP